MIRCGVEGLSMSPAVAKALLAFASLDDTRPVLCSVGIDLGCVCATDGHALVRFDQIETEDGAEPLRRYNRRLFSREAVERALTASKASGVVFLSWSKLSPEDVRYASIGQVEPIGGVPRVLEPVAFSATLLGRLAVVARACRRDREPGELCEPDDPPAVLEAVSGDMERPCRYRLGGEHWPTAVHTAHVTIMPMRPGGDAAVMAQARERVKEAARKVDERKRQAEQRARDRELAAQRKQERDAKRKAERERMLEARAEAKRIRARDRAQRRSPGEMAHVRADSA